MFGLHFGADVVVSECSLAGPGSLLSAVAFGGVPGRGFGRRMVVFVSKTLGRGVFHTFLRNKI